MFWITWPEKFDPKLFTSHGLMTWAIEVGNHLVNFLLFGAILGAWHWWKRSDSHFTKHSRSEAQVANVTVSF
jgi:hypothetical protein